jgi:predicted metal-dependent phosphoesterase TrpH
MSDTSYADLHLHTYYSDGSLSPQALMNEAVQVGLSCIAITDHDTVEALPAAFENKPSQLELISGIELSCEWHEQEVHILGYFIDYQNQELLKTLEEIRLQRVDRIHAMVDKLQGLGVNVSAQEVLNISPFGTVGRLHLAKVLLDKGVVSNIREAFVKFIGEHGPAYAGRFKLSIQEAVSVIKKCSGVPVWAHPYTLGNDDLLLPLVEAGLKGIEVYYPEHNGRRVEHYKALAKQYGLVCTGGSDYHGQIRQGIAIGSVRVSYQIVESLKKAR